MVQVAFYRLKITNELLGPMQYNCDYRGRTQGEKTTHPLTHGLFLSIGARIPDKEYIVKIPDYREMKGITGYVVPLAKIEIDHYFDEY